jgi:hypothetical protein
MHVLKLEPELPGNAAQLFQSNCHIGGDARVGGEDPVEGLTSNPKVARGLRHGQLQSRKNGFPKQDARVNSLVSPVFQNAHSKLIRECNEGRDIDVPNSRRIFLPADVQPPRIGYRLPPRGGNSNIRTDGRNKARSKVPGRPQE